MQHRICGWISNIDLQRAQSLSFNKFILQQLVQHVVCVARTDANAGSADMQHISFYGFYFTHVNNVAFVYLQEFTGRKFFQNAFDTAFKKRSKENGFTR
jgi:hypothetical protein